MGLNLREILRSGHGDAPSLYRRAWAESNDPLVAEARAQTLAIQRLEVWLRLAYSVLALAFLLAYWGLAEADNRVAGVIGIVLGVLAFAVVFVLRTGISHGRSNVQAMLTHLEERSGEPM
jgi:hypothetical protein